MLKKFTCKEWEDEVNRRGYLVKHQDSCMQCLHVVPAIATRRQNGALHCIYLNQTVHLEVPLYSLFIFNSIKIFKNGVTPNAEVWHNINESEMEEFNNLDKLFFRRLLGVPKSTPIESFYLELGAIPMAIIIKSRRVKYLHSILCRNPESMLGSFFVTQCNFPCKGTG